MSKYTNNIQNAKNVLNLIRYKDQDRRKKGKSRFIKQANTLTAFHLVA